MERERDREGEREREREREREGEKERGQKKMIKDKLKGGGKQIQRRNYCWDFTYHKLFHTKQQIIIIQFLTNQIHCFKIISQFFYISLYLSLTRFSISNWCLFFFFLSIYFFLSIICFLLIWNLHELSKSVSTYTSDLLNQYNLLLTSNLLSIISMLGFENVMFYWWLCATNYWRTLWPFLNHAYL